MSLLPTLPITRTSSPDSARRTTGQNRDGVSTLEMLVATSLAILCLGAVIALFSHYSRSYRKVDTRIENISEAWLTMRALADDISSADVPDGDPTRWAEAIRISAGTAMIRKRAHGNLVEVSYAFQTETKSLIRSVGGTRMSLIRNRCASFSIEPIWGEMVGSWPQSVSVHVRMALDAPTQGVPQSPPLELETTFIPECLNLRLQKRYVHQGSPDAL